MGRAELRDRQGPVGNEVLRVVPATTASSHSGLMEPSRHLCAIEDRGHGRVFVKRPVDAPSALRLAHEWQVYRRLPAGRLPIAPRPSSFGEAGLTVEALIGRDLHSVATSDGGELADLGAAAGRAVAVLHRDGERAGLPVALAEPRLPVHRPTMALLRSLSTAGIELVRMIQRSDELSALLNELEPSPATAFVHGDLRWENVFVLTDRPAGRAVRFVDWETGGLGDPAWDLGCFIASAIRAWINSIPSVPGLDAATLVRLATFDLAASASAVEAFMEAYLGHVSAVDPHETRLAAFREAGVRMVHLACDASVDLEDPVLTHALYLQVATNILRDPAAAARWLTRRGREPDAVRTAA